MIGLLDAFKLGLGAIVGGAAAILFCYLIIIPGAKDDARREERAAQLQKSMELIEQRGKTNEDVSKLDRSAICSELGGVFVNEKCE